jgi:hypothetical protein
MLYIIFKIKIFIVFIIDIFNINNDLNIKTNKHYILMNEYNTKLNNYFNYIKTNNNKIQKNKNNNELVDKLNKQNELYQSKINEINNIINQNLQNEKQLDNNGIYKTYKSNKICLDIETDKKQNILQIAYNNILLCSKDFYIYDGIHSKPFYPTINSIVLFFNQYLILFFN